MSHSQSAIRLHMGTTRFLAEASGLWQHARPDVRPRPQDGLRGSVKVRVHRLFTCFHSETGLIPISGLPCRIDDRDRLRRRPPRVPSHIRGLAPSKERGVRLDNRRARAAALGGELLIGQGEYQRGTTVRLAIRL